MVFSIEFLIIEKKMSILRTAAINQSRNFRRLGARYQSQLVKTEFEAERDAVKVHAARKFGRIIYR